MNLDTEIARIYSMLRPEFQAEKYLEQNAHVVRRQLQNEGISVTSDYAVLAVLQNLIAF